MRWATHKRISFEVLRRLDISLSDEAAIRFGDGIIAPDEWNNDYPHHHAKSEKIKEYLMKSRGYFLRSDLPNAFFHLGVALHYIQDSYTSMTSRNPQQHQSWEQDIENANFTDDLEKTITYSLGNRRHERDRCLQLASILSKEAQGRDMTLYMATLSGRAESGSFAKPVVDLNLAMRASYVVTKSVLGPKNSSALENKLRSELSHHEALMRTAEMELSDKIAGLVDERESLKKRKVPQSGIMSKIKNGILGIRIALKDLAAKCNYNKYTQGKHLEKVVRTYVKAANRAVIPYTGWYNLVIPKINPEVVEVELLSIQDIVMGLGETEHVLRESMNRVNIPTYCVGESELVRRTEFNRKWYSAPASPLKDNVLFGGRRDMALDSDEVLAKEKLAELRHAEKKATVVCVVGFVLFLAGLMIRPPASLFQQLSDISSLPSLLFMIFGFAIMLSAAVYSHHFSSERKKLMKKLG